jgi:hypothetical protein
MILPLRIPNGMTMAALHYIGLVFMLVLTPGTILLGFLLWFGVKDNKD